MDNQTIYKLSYGLFVLTSAQNGKDSGCIINTAGQVTLVPNRISITVDKTNYTHDLIIASKKFNISILSEKADFAPFQRFGFQSGRDVDKFNNYHACKRSQNGLYYITEGTNGYISGTVEQTIDLGTHTIFIAQVNDMESLDTTPSATYTYYQKHIKPQPQDQPKKGKTIWRCIICGYEYEGEELPADFICPLCKHPASDFVKVSG